MQFISFRIILKRIKAVPYLLLDKTVPLRKKLLVIFGLAYLFIPFDLMPVFPLDDVILWVFIIWHLKDELDNYWLGEKKDDFSKKFRSKNIVEGVEFNVEDDNDKE